MARALSSRARLLTLLVLMAIASLTLLPAPAGAGVERSSFFCLFGCHDQALRDVLSNILLLLPLGWCLSYWLPPRRAALACCLVSMTIEGLQNVIPGRDPSLRDILSNTVGGAAGVWLYHHWTLLVRGNSPQSLRAGVIGALLWMGVLAGTGAGMRLAPTHPTWFGQWMPVRDYYLPFPGALEAVRLGDRELGDGPLPETPQLRTIVEQDSFHVVLTARSGARPATQAIIFAIADADQETVMQIGQERLAIWARWRNHFTAWGLRGLTLRIPIAPGLATPSPITVSTGRVDRSVSLIASSDTVTRSATVPLTVGLGWTGLLPFDLFISREWMVLNPAWLAGLVLPLAYWFGRGAGISGLGLGLIALVLGLLVIPSLTGAARCTTSEWIGAGFGLLAGGILGWRSQALWSVGTPVP